jgi:hypothetical protein
MSNAYTQDLYRQKAAIHDKKHHFHNKKYLYHIGTTSFVVKWY